MAGLRTLAEIEAAGTALGEAMPPLTQEQADRAYALYAPHVARMTAAQAACTAA